MREAGISLPPENFINLQVEDLGGTLKALCSGSDPVTGIFTTADNCAFQIYSEAYRVGIGIPDDLSVIGFDDLNMSSMITPPLTTVRQDIKKKAAAACGLLMKNIKELIQLSSMNLLACLLRLTFGHRTKGGASLLRFQLRIRIACRTAAGVLGFCIAFLFPTILGGRLRKEEPGGL